MSTKFQCKYGQYTQAEGLAFSLATPGLLVFSGKTKEIYLDGKVFSASQDVYNELIDQLREFRDEMVVNVANQASITAENGTSNLLIANIGQGQDVEKDGELVNDGKIYTTGNFAVKIAGEYNDGTEGDRNFLATEETVKTAVDNLRTEILGTIDPEELEKTLDTIKEIQEALLNGSYTVDHVITADPREVETLHTEKVPVYNASTGDLEGYEYTNGEEGDNKEVYATEDLNGNVEYEEGYENLKQVAPIDSLVADIAVNENKAENFVTSTREDANVTIGVKYGTFKTGHGNVMDPTSNAYENGIATVEDVQKYIEERLAWLSYETDAEAVAGDINNNVQDGGTVNVPNDTQLNNPLLIGGNN